MNKVIHTENAPCAIGPYSQGIRSGNMIFTSGQIGLDPKTGAFAEGVEAQTRQALENLSAVLKEDGAELKDVVKTTVFLKDMNDFAKMNGVYAEFFTEILPARSAVEVARLPKDALVEIECVAVL